MRALILWALGEMISLYMASLSLTSLVVVVVNVMNYASAVVIIATIGCLCVFHIMNWPITSHSNSSTTTAASATIANTSSSSSSSSSSCCCF